MTFRQLIVVLGIAWFYGVATYGIAGVLFVTAVMIYKGFLSWLEESAKRKNNQLEDRLQKVEAAIVMSRM